MKKIDTIDERILQELENDGRISNSDLASIVGLSPSACLRRVQELEKSKVITGYRARINRAKLGTRFTAYITVGLSVHTKKSQKDFEMAIAESPEVIECHNVTGSFEWLFTLEGVFTALKTR